MPDIIVNSKNSLLTTSENMLESVKNYSSDIQSEARTVTKVTNYDDIDLSSATNTILNNFETIFEDFSIVAKTANDYINELMKIDVEDFSSEQKDSLENNNNSNSTGKIVTNVATGVILAGTSSYSYTGNYSNTGSYENISSSSSTTSSSTTTNNYSSSGQKVEESVIETAKGKEIILPNGLGSVRTYMGWQCITSKSSPQYKLMQTAGVNFDEEGFGKIGDRYVVATTTTFGKVGDYIDVYQEDGSVLKCIIGDIKNQNDANCNKWGHLNGECVVENIVDKNTWYKNGRGSHVNPGTSTCHPEWRQDIVKIVNKGNYFDYIAKENTSSSVN